MAVTYRVAVAGLGSIGRRHARLLKERGGIAVEAVEPSMDAVASARAEIGDFKLHESWDAMLQSRPDVVVIATPTPLHARQAIEALETGAHVLCEKPMTDNTADARKIVAAAESFGRCLDVGFMWHFAPVFRRLRKMVQEGALGRVLHIHARIGTYITLVNSASRYQMRNPGSLFLDYSHQPDLFCWLLGKRPHSVMVTGFAGGNMELMSDPNVAVAVYSYAEPLVGTVHLNYVQMPQCHDYEIVGDEAWAQVSFPANTLTLGRRRDQSAVTETFPFERDDLYRAEHQTFFDAIEGRGRVETTAAEGLVSTAICEASIESWRSKATVPVSV